MTTCLHCMRLVNYKLIIKPITVTIKGREITYKEGTAICCECGGEVYSEKIHDDNVKRRTTAYFNTLRGVQV